MLGETRSIADFQYKDNDIGDMVVESMYELEFQGIKAYIDFDQYGDMHTDMNIFQQKGKQLQHVVYI